MDELHIGKRQTYPEMSSEHRSGWDIFEPEVAFFIYDFFKFELDGYEKLMFYCYYINGMTLEEIASSADCSFQWIGTVIQKIEKRLYWAWKNQDKWRELHKHDGKSKPSKKEKNSME